MNKAFVDILVSFVALLFGSFVLCTSGFGIGLAASPFMLLAIDAKTVVVIINTVSLAAFGLLILQNRSKINYREMCPPIAAGILGVPVGLVLFGRINPEILSIFIDTLIVILGFFAKYLNRQIINKNTPLFIVVSFIVGGLLTSTGIGGPLMALVALSRGWTKDTIRGSLPLYYLFVEGIAVVGYSLTGRLDRGTLTLTIVGLVPVIVGFFLASAFAKKVPETTYRKLIVVVIIAAGLLVVFKEASGLV